jgi:putative tryptophan/tyrosine transport system substrate-binding protein
MRRREFVTILAATATWPIAGSAQQAQPVRRIGVLMASAENNAQYQTYMAAFRDTFHDLGWAEGRTIQIDYRWAAFDAKLMEQFSKELLALQPEVILSNNTPTTAALLQQTRTVPVVFATVADPVGSGFVAGLAQPGGNATGFITAEASLGGKWVELLKEVAPRVSRLAILFNPTAAPYAEYYLKPIKAAAASLAVETATALVHDAQEIDSVIAAQAREPNNALLVIPETFTQAHRAEIASAATRHRLPAVYPYRLFAEAGGLLAYGDDLTDNFRRAASYIDRILKGTKPNELPVQAPVKYELVINMKTAKALGLDVPAHLQQLADEVIE